MALNTFIKIDGIKGESQDDKHKDEIDVLSWSWGVEQSSAGRPGPGGGGGAGKVSIRDLSITKRTDIATPQLMLHCATGEHIKDASLMVEKHPLQFLSIKMSDVLVDSVSPSDSGESSITENVALSFSKVELDCVQQKPDGTTGPAYSFKWDIKANKPF